MSDIENLIQNCSVENLKNFFNFKRKSTQDFKPSSHCPITSDTEGVFPNRFQEKFTSVDIIGYVKTLELPVFRISLKAGVFLQERSVRRLQFDYAKHLLSISSGIQYNNFTGWLGDDQPVLGLNHAIFVFVDNANNFRFSLVENENKESEKTKIFRRYTFYVSKEQTNRTFMQRMALDWTNYKDLKEAFSVEKLSDEFFDKYKEIYQDFVEYGTGKRMVKQGNKWVENITGNPNQGILGQFASSGDAEKSFRDYIKKMMGRLVFLQFLQKKGWLTNIPNYLSKCYKNSIEQDNFLEAVLEPLFFGVLNTPSEEREEKFKAEDWNLNLLKEWKQVPYLNGGLFEQDRLDQIKIAFPKDYFAKLFEMFDQFNFTIDENAPDDAVIGVDPEMLGRIFENLLEDNKDKGAFYTPKEIVRYMCRESLTAYLGDTPEIRALLADTPDSSGIAEPDKQGLIAKLKAVKICDPAIGSGAFPMGMLNLLLRTREALGDVDENDKKAIVQVKKEIIQNNIYGVDIDPGAVDIARLRFWLSIVVDEVTPIPLPNLDYKIMQGNSLLEQFHDVNLQLDLRPTNKRGKKISTEAVDRQMCFAWDDETAALEKIKTAMADFFDPKGKTDKTALRTAIDLSVKNYIKTKCGNVNSINTEIDAMDLGNKPFFLWHLYFADVFAQGGFDIVIGNPPYVRVQNMRHADIDQYKRIYDTAWRRIDISTLFFELFSKMICKNGVLCFISSNQFASAEYGRKIRKYISEKTILYQVVDFGGLPVFESAITYVSIFFGSMCKKRNFKYCHITKMPFNPDTINFSTCSYLNFCEETWNFSCGVANNIIKKVRLFQPLSKIAFSRGGIITGNDKLFLFPENSEIPFENELGLSIIRTERINRYYLGTPDLMVFYPCFYNKDTLQTEVTPLDTIKQKYNKAFLYITENVEALKKRKDSRRMMGERLYWYSPVRFGQLSVFKSIKILTPGIVKHNKFTLDNQGYAYSFGNMYSILVNDHTQTNIYVLLAILNSSLIEFYLHATAPVKQGGYFSYNATVLDGIPISYPINSCYITEIETLVKQIIMCRRENENNDTSSQEKDIDRIVYQLYGLTLDEIKVVENSLAAEKNLRDNVKKAKTAPKAAKPPVVPASTDDNDDENDLD